MKTISEFKDIFDDFVKSERNGTFPYDYKVPNGYIFNSQDDRNDNDYIKWSWITGGTGGGSCWDEGESNHYSIEGDPEPNLTPFDDFITENFPDISFVKYKLLLAEIKNDTCCEYEYYGNSTNYAIRYVSKQDLLKALQKKDEVEKE